jgi:hypothetical protein
MVSRGAAAPAPEISARARASRINGARSRGPKTEEGKTRSAQNALKHGLRAERFVLLPDEDAAEFEAKEAALVEDLAPEGALEGILVRRIARAARRLSRRPHRGGAVRAGALRRWRSRSRPDPR